jgi:predicted ArsR family transcriptional regulator
VSTPPSPPTRWDLAHLLSEPTRRAVFECVRAARGTLSREEVAEAVGINRRLATFHLDRLSEAGVLLTDYARPEGVGGPGAGRPAKRYRSSEVELDLSVPPRQYEFVARLLARAIVDDPHDAEASSLRVAREEGRRVGALRRVATKKSSASEVLISSLEALGYEPSSHESSIVRLQNCPFRAAAEVATDLVCGMNCQLVAGLLEGLGLDPHAAELEPAPPQCCVTINMHS